MSVGSAARTESEARGRARLAGPSGRRRGRRGRCGACAPRGAPVIHVLDVLEAEHLQRERVVAARPHCRDAIGGELDLCD